MAIEWGSAITESNMESLLLYGADGEVKRDGGSKKTLYELEIKREETMNRGMFSFWCPTVCRV